MQNVERRRSIGQREHFLRRGRLEGARDGVEEEEVPCRVGEERRSEEVGVDVVCCWVQKKHLTAGSGDGERSNEIIPAEH